MKFHRPARHELDAMFLVALQNPKAAINRPGRGLGRHAGARFERSRAKAAKRRGEKYASRIFAPAVRSAEPYAQLSPKVDGIRHRWDKGQLVPK